MSIEERHFKRKFKLVFSMDGDTFHSDPLRKIAEVLRHIADRVERGGQDQGGIYNVHSETMIGSFGIIRRNRNPIKQK